MLLGTAVNVDVRRAVGVGGGIGVWVGASVEVGLAMNEAEGVGVRDAVEMEVGLGKTVVVQLVTLLNIRLKLIAMLHILNICDCVLLVTVSGQPDAGRYAG